MIELFEICRTKANNFFFGEDKLSPMELMYKLIEKVNEVIQSVNSFQGSIDGKEDSVNITNSRKLSPSGNFTGKWFGESFTSIDGRIDTNEDQIDYIAQQFADGQTGLVVDGGFFEDEGIRKNYDGGVF